MRIVAVVGATATGKSDLAVELAVALDGEVINADSMQLYRGMDIGTAKLTAEERRGVRHHLLDIWDVTKAANVAEYQKLAEEVIDDIAGRGKTPVLVGGSGLYIRAALGDLDFPGTDEDIRRRLEAELAKTGPAPLHERLTARDPEAAAAILPSNSRRIVRALEVIELTGRPFSATMPSYTVAANTVSANSGSPAMGSPTAGPAGTGSRPVVQIGVAMPRPELDSRIDARVERMWDRGLEAEVRALEARGLRDSRTASRALGYQQMLRAVAGELTMDEAKRETARATRRFARRQESWFRRDPRVTWVQAGDGVPARAMSAINYPERIALTAQHPASAPIARNLRRS